jgi:hypothetical protein
MARRTNRERATDRLNLALARISAAAEIVEHLEGPERAATATALRKQFGEALDEAHAALADIRDVAATL